MESTGLQKEVNAEHTVSHPHIGAIYCYKNVTNNLLLEMSLEMIEDKYIATPILLYTRPYLAIGQGGQLPPQRNWLQSIIKYYLFIAASY